MPDKTAETIDEEGEQSAVSVSLCFCLYLVLCTDRDDKLEKFDIFFVSYILPLFFCYVFFFIQCSFIHLTIKP